MKSDLKIHRIPNDTILLIVRFVSMFSSTDFFTRQANTLAFDAYKQEEAVYEKLFDTLYESI